MGIRGAWNRGGTFDKTSTGVSLTLYSMPEWWLGLLLIAFFAVGVGPLPGLFPTGGLHSIDVRARHRGVGARHDVAPDAAGDHADVGLSRRLRPDHAQLAARRAGRGLPDHGSRQGPARRRRCATGTRCATRCCRRPRSSPSTSASSSPVRSRSRPSSRSPGSACSATEALTVPDYWVLQGTFLIASAGVILANLAANLRLRPPRPAGPDMSAPTTTATPDLSAKALARRRRREARRRSWRIFRTHRSGMVGLVILAFFVLVAILAPRDRAPRGAGGHQGDRRGARAAVDGVLAGHRRQGPVGAHAADLGSPDLAVRRASPPPWWR